MLVLRLKDAKKNYNKSGVVKCSGPKLVKLTNEHCVLDATGYLSQKKCLWAQNPRGTNGGAGLGLGWTPRAHPPSLGPSPMIMSII
jgi:hypothetical protein